MYSKFFLFIYIVVCVILFIWLETKASNDDSVEKSSWGDVLKTLLSSLFAGFFIAALIIRYLIPNICGCIWRGLLTIHLTVEQCLLWKV